MKIPYSLEDHEFYHFYSTDPRMKMKADMIDPPVFKEGELEFVCFNHNASTINPVYKDRSGNRMCMFWGTFLKITKLREDIYHPGVALEIRKRSDRYGLVLHETK